MPVDVMNLNTINPREERYLHGTMTIVTLCVRVGSMAEKCCSRLKDCWQETQLGKKQAHYDKSKQTNEEKRTEPTETQIIGL